MSRAKTVKKTGSGASTVTISKAAPSELSLENVKVYSMTESFAKGDMIHHKVWDDFGEVIEEGTTEDGINKIKVSFKNVGLKTLRVG